MTLSSRIFVIFVALFMVMGTSPHVMSEEQATLQDDEFNTIKERVITVAPSTIRASGLGNDLYVKGFGRDPLSVSMNIPTSQMARSDNDIHILQMDGTANPALLDMMAYMGGTVLGYIPNYAYLVQIPRGMEQSFNGLKFSRWIGEYHPYYALDPTLDSSLEDSTGFPDS